MTGPGTGKQTFTKPDCDVCAGIDPDCANCELLTDPEGRALVAAIHQRKAGQDAPEHELADDYERNPHQ